MGVRHRLGRMAACWQLKATSACATTAAAYPKASQPALQRACTLAVGYHLIISI